MKEPVDEPISTIKVAAVPAMNEREYAQYCYKRAREELLKDPNNPIKLQALLAANRHLFEVEDLYRIAARLLLERAIRLRDAVKKTFQR